jgi:hypothetical protein
VVFGPPRSILRIPSGGGPPYWSRKPPRALTIPTVIPLTKLADVRELLSNLKTAQSLGITVPPSLRARAEAIA